jgi:hypothetical protein
MYRSKDISLRNLIRCEYCVCCQIEKNLKAKKAEKRRCKCKFKTSHDFDLYLISMVKIKLLLKKLRKKRKWDKKFKIGS